MPGPPIPSRTAQPDPIHFRRPTPNLADRIFFERHDTRGDRSYALPTPGTAHPNSDLSTFKFTTAQPSDDDPLTDLWFYVNERANQETYNGEDDFPFGSKDYPRRTRTTIVLRSAYSPIADLADDPVTSTLKLTSQSKTNLPDPVLNALFVQHVRVYEILPGPWIPFTRWSEELGPIQGRRRTVQNANTAPTLTATSKTTYEARDGSSIVAWQIEETNSDGTGGAGNPAYPILTRKGFDPDSLAATTTTRQVVVLPASQDTIGSVAGAGYVIDSEIVPLNAFLGTKVTVTMAIPATRTEYESMGFQFPALFVYIIGWVTPSLCGVHNGPFPGINYTLSAHRTASKPGVTVISYTNGPPASLPTTWNVTTPGNASRLFPIQDNTIHNAILMQDVCGAGTQTVETLPASTPSSYTAGDSLTIRAGTRKWRGNMWEKRVTVISE